jgi:hypothetical protein
MRSVELVRRGAILPLFVLAAASPSAAQAPETATRQGLVTEAQEAKVPTLRPYIPARFEKVVTRVQDTLLVNATNWHPFFQNSYRGGGFAPGVGYRQFVSPYSTVDVRGSVSIRGYKLAEAEFLSPRLWHRQLELSVVGGWRDATQVAFYGVGMDTTAAGRTNFAFEQPFAGVRLRARPTRRQLVASGGVDVARWSFKTPSGTAPSIGTAYTPGTLPGLGLTTTLVHAQAALGFDWRPSPGYARRGGFYGVTAHDYTDTDSRVGFRRVDYEVTQHVPILRETWAISLRGRASTTWDKKGQSVPFYLLPSLGGGSDLRGYSSFRFRGENSLLLQGEWRIMVNRFLDTAVFYDTGKVTARKSDLDLNGLQHDYGFGVRFHTPFATVLRVDIARGSEGTTLVFATSPAF